MSNRLRQGSRLAWLALAGWLIAASAQAQSNATTGKDQPADHRPDRSPNRSLSDQDRAANAAREATGGRVLGVQGDRVRVLQPDGRVRSLQVDPKSGMVRD